MRFALLTLALQFILTTVTAAQVPVVINSSTDNVGFAGAVCGKHMVRDSLGFLYMIRMEESVPGIRPIVLAASYDGGVSWFDIISMGINDASTGESALPLVNSVSLAIDDQDNLHVQWYRGSSTTGYYNQYYRAINPYSLVMSPVVDLKAQFGISTTVKTGACNIAVDASGTVWLTAGSNSSWRARLLRSAVPYATTGVFTSVGNISTIASAQFTRLAVDLAGVIHCAYYENTGSGDFRHRAYDPSTSSWGAATLLGNISGTHDYTGALACDGLGNTHILVNRDASGSGNPSLVYFRLDALGVFSGPILVMSATNAQFNGIANQHTIDLACDEATGDAYALFRDLSNGGELTVHVLPFGATSFAPLSQLAPPSFVQHYYYAPRARGSLYPATNNTGTDLHLTWRQMWPAPFQLNFLSLSGASSTSAVYPGNGTDAAIEVSVNGVVDNQPSNVHNIVGGDVVQLRYFSPLNQLTNFPFLAVAQPFTTGFPAPPSSFVGDPVPTIIYSGALPTYILADGLSQPFQPFTPVLGSFVHSGLIPASLSGTNTSFMILLIPFDPGRNAQDFGNAEAHELVVQ